MPRQAQPRPARPGRAQPRPACACPSVAPSLPFPSSLSCSPSPPLLLPLSLSSSIPHASPPPGGPISPAGTRKFTDQRESGVRRLEEEASEQATLKGRPAKRAEAPLKGSKVSKPTHPAGRRSNAAREIAAARAVTARIGACMCMRRSPICPGAPGGPLRPTGPSAPRSPSRPSRPAGPGGPAGPCRRRPLPRVRGGRGEEGDDVGQREDGGRRRQSHPTVTVVALLTPLARGKRETEAKSRSFASMRDRGVAKGSCRRSMRESCRRPREAYKWLQRIAQYRGDGA